MQGELIFDSAEWRVRRDAQMLDWFGGNQHALDFVLDIIQIAEVWDAITDRDPIDDAQLDNAMWAAVLRLPLNPFYHKHATYLTPLIVHAINTWKDANVLAKGNRDQRAVAYTLRHMDLQIVQAVVRLTRGDAVLRQLGPEIWTLYAARPDDGIDKWLSGETT